MRSGRVVLGRDLDVGHQTVKEGDRTKHRDDDGDQLEWNWRPKCLRRLSLQSQTSDIVTQIIKNVYINEWIVKTEVNTTETIGIEERRRRGRSM